MRRTAVREQSSLKTVGIAEARVVHVIDVAAVGSRTCDGGRIARRTLRPSPRSCEWPTPDHRSSGQQACRAKQRSPFH